jgi:hypothetical protein
VVRGCWSACQTDSRVRSLTLPADRAATLGLKLEERVRVGVAEAGAMLFLHLYSALVHEREEQGRTLPADAQRSCLASDRRERAQQVEVERQRVDSHRGGTLGARRCWSSGSSTDSWDHRRPRRYPAAGSSCASSRTGTYSALPAPGWKDHPSGNCRRAHRTGCHRDRAVVDPSALGRRRLQDTTEKC